MRTSILFLAAMLLTATGCSNPDFYWFRAGRTFEEVKTDYCQCRDKARRDAAEVVAEEYFDHLRSPARSPSSYDRSGDEDKHTMDAAEARATWGALYEQNAFAGCMKGRGYVPLPAHRTSSGLRKKSLPLGAIAGQ